MSRDTLQWLSSARSSIKYISMGHQHNQGTDHMACLAEVSLATADATFATISGPVRHTSPRRRLSAVSMRLLLEKLVLDKSLTEPTVRARRSCESRRSAARHFGPGSLLLATRQSGSSRHLLDVPFELCDMPEFRSAPHLQISRREGSASRRSGRQHDIVTSGETTHACLMIARVSFWHRQHETVQLSVNSLINARRLACAHECKRSLMPSVFEWDQELHFFLTSSPGNVAEALVSTI